MRLHSIESPGDFVNPRCLSWAALEISFLKSGNKFNSLFYLNILRKVSVGISNINTLIQQCFIELV